MENNTVRTRFAPSPTGFVHIGAIRTILYDYALAKRNNGQVIIRLEDTDRNRLVEGAEEYLYKMVKAYGITWDEGPDIGGPYAPYKQSERLPMYQKAAHELVAKGFAYYAFDTVERLDKLRAEQEKAGVRTHYDNRDRDLDPIEAKKRVDSGEKYCVRLKIPFNSKIEFLDPISKKKTIWDSKDLDDIILLKSDGYPTYHLAVVIDDVAMKITHVLRGPEWIATTPYHVYLYGCMEYTIPEIIHVTVIFDPRTGKKFSKRDETGAFLADKYIKEGYLPEGVLNYIMLLGWAPKDNRELYTLSEFVDAFGVEGLQKANPIFNQKKLEWFAGQYFRTIPLDKLIERIKVWANEYGKEYLDVIEKINLNNEKEQVLLKMVQERSITFVSFLSQLKNIYFRNEKYEVENAKGIKERSKDELSKATDSLIEDISKLNDDSSLWTHEEWEMGIREIAKTYTWKDADVFMLLRVSVLTTPFSPPLFEVMQYLGKSECLERIKKFRTTLP
ncbi:MAG: glutamate--tRNA ligase [bacterium]